MVLHFDVETPVLVAQLISSDSRLYLSPGPFFPVVLRQGFDALLE
jgi:hypothetical protein